MSWQKNSNNKSDVGGEFWSVSLRKDIALLSDYTTAESSVSSARRQQGEYAEAEVGFVRFSSQACSLWSTISNWKCVMSHSVVHFIFLLSAIRSLIVLTLSTHTCATDDWFISKFTIISALYDCKCTMNLIMFQKGKCVTAVFHHQLMRRIVVRVFASGYFPFRDFYPFELSGSSESELQALQNKCLSISQDFLRNISLLKYLLTDGWCEKILKMCVCLFFF